MNLGFNEIITSMEAEIKTEYIGGAINWADQHYDNAWSNAMNRFDRALVAAIERKDYTAAKSEGEFYKSTVLELLKKFKAANNINETTAFLDAIKSPAN